MAAATGDLGFIGEASALAGKSSSLLGGIGGSLVRSIRGGGAKSIRGGGGGAGASHFAVSDFNVLIANRYHAFGSAYDQCDCV